jgi:hypothetical protein
MMENKNAEIPPEASSFTAHVFQVATAALVYMGAAQVPGAEKVEKNLPLAKLTIDTLDMLKAKTDGNRTPDETALLDDLLYQLKLAFVQAKEGNAVTTPPPQPGR